MSFYQSFLLSLKNILSSKGRSFLTMLGIIIGVGSVIVIVGMGNGTEIYMTEQFQSMGTNLLTVSISGRGSSRSISTSEMYAVVDKYPEHFNAISPTVGMYGPVKIGNESVTTTRIQGVSEDYLKMRGYDLRDGRFIQYVDTVKRTSVCVVGSYIAKEYFGGDAVGQTLKIRGNGYTIVGIMDEIAESEEGTSDDYIYVPFSTAAKQSGIGNITSYSVALVSEENATIAKGVLESELYKVFGSENAYSVISMSEILDMMSSMLGVMVGILAAIAAISLVVGGVGIMNIMLVSVSERTREIGIRKALGAKQRHIMWQFVIEAATTSAIGGLFGIGFGYLLSSAATVIIEMSLEESLPVIPSTSSVIMAFGISAGIGILFGYLPARKAGRLNPIDALRYE